MNIRISRRPAVAPAERYPCLKLAWRERYSPFGVLARNRGAVVGSHLSLPAHLHPRRGAASICTAIDPS
jgi:hypothetical protein